jgi:hypothetical protein
MRGAAQTNAGAASKVAFGDGSIPAPGRKGVS